MKKRILIPWSGGVDSTGLIIEAMKSGHIPYYVHLDCNQPEAARRTERIRLDDLRLALIEAVERKHGGSIKLYKPRQLHSTAKINFSETDMPLKQLPAWFMHLVSMVADKRGEPEFEEVQMGYVMGDDAAGALSHLAEAFRHLCIAVHGLNFEPPKLTFPLITTRKSQIIGFLKSYDLQDKIWYCELPQLYDSGPIPCERWPSCVKHRRAVEDIRLDREYNEQAYTLWQNNDHRTPETPAPLTPSLE